MFRRLCLSLVLLSCSTAAWCQVEPSASGGSGTTSDDDSLMTLPPSVSGSFYPSSVGSEERENTLSAGIRRRRRVQRQRAHGRSDSKDRGGVLHGSTERHDEREDVAFARLIELQSGICILSPDYRIEPGNPERVADFQYRLTPHTTVGAQEMFQQNSSVLSEPYTIAGSHGI